MEWTGVLTWPLAWSPLSFWLAFNTTHLRRRAIQTAQKLAAGS
jgi:hypothetical protein